MSLYDYKPGEYPEIIYLVPTDLDGPVWETEPAPGEGMDPDDAVRYVRADLVEGENNDTGSSPVCTQ